MKTNPTNDQTNSPQNTSVLTDLSALLSDVSLVGVQGKGLLPAPSWIVDQLTDVRASGELQLARSEAALGYLRDQYGVTQRTGLFWSRTVRQAVNDLALANAVRHLATSSETRLAWSV